MFIQPTGISTLAVDDFFPVENDPTPTQPAKTSDTSVQPTETVEQALTWLKEIIDPSSTITPEIWETAREKLIALEAKRSELTEEQKAQLDSIKAYLDYFHLLELSNISQ